MTNRIVPIVLAALVLAGGVSTASPPSPADVGAVVEAYQRDHAAWVQRVSSETDPARQAALVAERPDKSAVAERVAALAEAAGTSEAGFLGWSWVYMEAEADALRTRALEALLSGWAARPEMVHLLPALERDGHARAPAAFARLATGPDENSAVSLGARVAHASWLARFDPVEGRSRAIDLLEGVARTNSELPYPEGGTMSETARSRLFALQHLAVGATVPDIVGEDLARRPFKLSDHRGRVVLLTFWAHWCSGCMLQAKYERELVAAYEGRPFVMLGVNCDVGPPPQVREMNRKKNVPWRSFRNDAERHPFGTTARKWNVRTLPTTYLIGHDGIILETWEGKLATRESLFAAVERAMARKTPPVEDAPPE
ncbi:MAG: peroxiredoxin family protein [Planctomycetota bacterium]|jgi:peroxiredoxin